MKPFRGHLIIRADEVGLPARVGGGLEVVNGDGSDGEGCGVVHPTHTHNPFPLRPAKEFIAKYRNFLKE